MYQHWRDLLFLHKSFHPDQIRPLIPKELEIDTFPDSTGEERAWVGLVPFRMFGIRAYGFPALPVVSAFPETNVRTYVHHNGRPGVWFFSLDAARWLACKTARALYHLPYYFAFMGTLRDGARMQYRSTRLERPEAKLTIDAEIGEELPLAEPGSLEFFLIERYLLFSMAPGSRIPSSGRNGELAGNAIVYSGQVHHEPYPLRMAKVSKCEQTLTNAVGIQCDGWDHVCFSEGVDVEVFPLRREK